MLIIYQLFDETSKSNLENPTNNIWSIFHSLSINELQCCNYFWPSTITCKGDKEIRVSIICTYCHGILIILHVITWPSSKACWQNYSFPNHVSICITSCESIDYSLKNFSSELLLIPQIIIQSHSFNACKCISYILVKKFSTQEQCETLIQAKLEHVNIKLSCSHSPSLRFGYVIPLLVWNIKMKAIFSVRK